MRISPSSPLLGLVSAGRGRSANHRRIGPSGVEDGAWNSESGCRLFSTRCDQRAITLTELLVVLAIMGLVATISLPAIKGIGQSNTIASASRQLIDDISLARRMAINNRSTVYMLFMGPVGDEANYNFLSPVQKTNLLKHQFTGYILLGDRKLGDQPGQANSHYLTSWRTLPDGVFIATKKFVSPALYTIPVNGYSYDVLTFTNRPFPYPVASSANKLNFFYITFEPSGRVDSLLQSSQGLCVIPLARGSIMLEQNAAGLVWTPAAPFERPANNSEDNPALVVIDGPTGRARLERPEL